MMTAVATLAFVTALSFGPESPAGSLEAGGEKSGAAQTAGATDGDVIRQRVKEGQQVRVTDDQGRHWQGRIEALGRDSLVLRTKDRQRHDVPYAAILWIDRPRDTLANGAIIGFLSGAALGLLALVAEENSQCQPAGFFSCVEPPAGAYVLLPALVGGAGAGIGIGIDALVRRDSTVYRRGSRAMLAPTVRPGVYGVSVSVRW